MIGKICGVGAYAPEHYIDNEALSKIVDTSDEWIRERTGIGKRHIIDGDTTVTMAVKAAERAISDAGVKAEELDMILVSTLSSNVIVPCTACAVQKELGAKNAVCFDLNAACTGFMVAYNTAQVYIEAGLYKNILIIGAESLSTIIDPTDRGTCILFGDGAGAAVIQAKEGKMIPPIMHSDGVKGEVLYCETGGFLKMDGQEVFKFAVKRVPECINDLLEANDLTIDDIDYFVLHQANKRIIEAAAKRLRAPIEKFPMNMEEYGNTSSASIPILLDEMKQKGMLKAGQKIVMAGFGAGLSWGASLLEW